MKKILVVGSLNMDLVIDVDSIPKAGETILGDKLTLIPGGKGANQAYAMGKLNGKVNMIGAVGNDTNKEQLLKNLSSVNVNTSGVEVIENTDTGIAVISVDRQGENCITVIPGANNLVTKESIDKNINLIEESDIIVMQLEIPIDTVCYITKIAKEKNKLIVLDPAPAKANLPIDLYKNIDIIKPNEIELEIISGMKIENEQDVIKAANIILDKGVKTVIATLR